MSGVMIVGAFLDGTLYGGGGVISVNDQLDRLKHALRPSVATTNGPCDRLVRRWSGVP